MEVILQESYGDLRLPWHCILVWFYCEDYVIWLQGVLVWFYYEDYVIWLQAGCSV
jgi:hypothetical protein